MAREYKKQQDAARTDPLTGTLNQKGFEEMAGRAHYRSLLALDIDHFKKVNDTYGHPVGDSVLRAFTRTIGRRLRKSDVFGRVGGEEFVVLIGEAEGGALTVAEKLREAVHKIDVGGVKITTSIGISTREWNATDLTAMITEADQALYAAKNSGRDCVVHFDAFSKNV